MHYSVILNLAVTALLVSGQDSCPEIPDTGVTIGEPVPPRPQDIPPGCSDYEILVGEHTRIMIFAFRQLNK